MPPWNAYTLADIEAGTLTTTYRAQMRMRQATRELCQAVERFASTLELRQAADRFTSSLNGAFPELAKGREPPDAA